MKNEKAIEKAMKEIVWYYEQKPDGAIFADFLVKKKVCEEEKVSSLIAHLKAKGLISYEVVHKGYPEEIHLKDAGWCYLTNRAEEKARERKMYAIGWIQFAISTLIAFSAMIVSIIALKK